VTKERMKCPALAPSVMDKMEERIRGSLGNVDIDGTIILLREQWMRIHSGIASLGNVIEYISGRSGFALRRYIPRVVQGHRTSALFSSRDGIVFEKRRRFWDA